MTHTHRIDVSGEVVTKTYVDWGRGEHLREWTALQVIHAEKPHLVPAPIELVQTGARPSVTMSKLPGEPLSGTLTTEQLQGLRAALGELWSVSPAGVEPVDYEAFVDRVRQGISSWTGSGVVAEAQQAAADWLAGSAADELIKPVAIIIGHVDPNLANYLWDGTRIRIIDFEDAGRSDLAIELANLVEHIASRATDWTGFLEHFPVDPARLQAARRLYATFWLTLLRPDGPSSRRNPPGTAELHAKRLLNLLS
ncbi:phosphotransferase family protein [Kribbella sp. NPDC051620]|uniref:phosphotransferase family protein n=1 Tax=Kribbella sp. NPDC051620 TaxID=3364120 RepID=UPI00378EC8F3